MTGTPQVDRMPMLTPQLRSIPQSPPDLPPRRQDAVASTLPSPPPAGTAEFGRRRVAFFLSMGLHSILMVVLALQMMSNRSAQPAIDTLLSISPDDSSGAVGQLVTLDLKPFLNLPDQGAPNSLAAAVGKVAATAPALDLHGALSGRDGTGGAGASGFMNLPKNAVHAGSFAAWTTPQGVDNVFRRFKPVGEPGDSPEPGELYYITIQIRLPPDRGSYSLSDLNGEVVGTDRYRQRIPQGVFVMGGDGKLVRPPPTGKLKARQHVVEFVMVVPGAARLVEDTIEINSTLLGESQTLTLRFGGDVEPEDPE